MSVNNLIMQHFVHLTRGFIVLCLLLNGLSLSAQPACHKDSLLADFRQYIALLEATHPDPYTAFGGRMFFHKAADRMERNLSRLPLLTPAVLADSLRAFNIPLHDEHTFINAARTAATSERYAAVTWNVIPDGLIVLSVDKAHQDLLGARLDSINGMAVGDVLKKTEQWEGNENLYGQYLSLSQLASREDFVKSLSPQAEQDSVCYALTLRNGKKRYSKLPLLLGKDYENVPVAQVPVWDNYPSGYLAYKFVDSGKQTMLVHVPRIMARENYAWCLKQGWDNAYENIRQFFKRTLKKAIPVDTARALSMIPSFSETFASLLQQMKAHRSENLIIDLRGNGGGWTPVTLPVLLMLYGDDFFKVDGMEYITRLSPLFLEKHKQTLAQWNRQNGTHYQIGDYIFEKEDTTTPVAERRASFIKECLSDTRSLLTELHGRPLYRPAHVYVVTDVETFSAAFHFAWYLHRLGAVVVGVPCRQAPNTFMETTPFTLLYSKLKGSISNSMQVCFPANDRRARIFWPDRMPSYADYARYNFDWHTEVLWLLDEIKQ